MGEYIQLPPESDTGWIEYKWCLTNVGVYKMNKLSSQMRWRVKQTRKRVAIYVIGVRDDGKVTGLNTTDFITTFLNLIDCAMRVGLYACLITMRRLPTGERWGILQVFKMRRTCNASHTDTDVPVVPVVKLPEYLRVKK